MHRIQASQVEDFDLEVYDDLIRVSFRIGDDSHSYTYRLDDGSDTGASSPYLFYVSDAFGSYYRATGPQGKPDVLNPQKGWVESSYGTLEDVDYSHGLTKINYDPSKKGQTNNA